VFFLDHNTWMVKFFVGALISMSEENYEMFLVISRQIDFHMLEIFGVFIQDASR